MRKKETSTNVITSIPTMHAAIVRRENTLTHNQD